MNTPTVGTPAGETAGSPPRSAVASEAERASWMSGIARIRDTSAWITKAFTGLAVVLVAGGPILAGLNNLKFSVWTALAMLFGIAALAGVGLVIHSASRVMLTESTDVDELLTADSGALAELRERVKKNNTMRELYLGGRPSLKGLVVDIQTLGIAKKELELDLQGRPENDVDRPELLRQIHRAESELTSLQSYLDRLLHRGLYEQVRATFNRAIPRMFIGAGVTVVGTWAYLALAGIGIEKTSTDPASNATAAAVTPIVSTLTWSSTQAVATTPPKATANTEIPQVARADQTNELRKMLHLEGAACDQLQVTLLEGTGAVTTPWKVTTLRDPHCPEPPTSFWVDDRFATVSPRLEKAKNLPAPELETTQLALPAACGFLGAALLATVCWVFVGRPSS